MYKYYVSKRATLPLLESQHTSGLRFALNGNGLSSHIVKRPRALQREKHFVPIAPCTRSHQS